MDEKSRAFVTKLLLPSLSGLLVLVFFIASFSPIKSRDLFWHLETGKYISEHNEIPVTDPFSYTKKGAPWRAHEWLTDLVFYRIVVLFGMGGLIVLKAGFTAATFFLLFRICAIKSNELIAFFVVLLGGLVCIPSFLVRPQVFTYFLFVVTVYCLERFPERKYILLYPLVAFFWANVHGAFIFGHFLFLLYYVVFAWAYIRHKTGSGIQYTSGLPFRTVSLIGFIAVITPMISPGIYKVYTYPWQYVGQTLHKSYIFEWFPPNFQEELPAELFLFCLVAALIFLPRSELGRALVILLPFTHLALTSGRNMPFWVFVSCPFIVKAIPREFGESSGAVSAWLKHRWDNLLVVSRQGSLVIPVLLIIAVTIVMLQHPPFSAHEEHERWIDPGIFPVKAVDFMETMPSLSPLFNDYDWGGYIMWRTEIPVYIDGRADLYIPDIMQEYFSVIRPRDDSWQKVLERRDIRIVLCKKGSFLHVLLSGTHDWNKLYSDHLAVIYQRSNLTSHVAESGS